MADKNFEIKATFSAVDKLSRIVGRMETRIARYASVTSRGLKKVDRVMSKIAAKTTKALKWSAAAAAGGIALIGVGISKVMQQFSKIEDAEAAFTPLLKGAERAKEMVAALNKTAASTPFQFETLAGSANQLLPIMNGNIEKTIEYVRMLGDTAGGNAQKFESITRGFTKAMMKGKADMEALNMISEAGVPIFDQLAKQIGKTGPALFDAVRKGKVSGDVLVATFQRMTSEGGIFYKGMEIASKTLSGKMSTLKDNVALTAAEFGSVLAPVMKEGVDILIDLAGQTREWVIANKDLIRTKFQEIVAKIPPILREIGHYSKIAWGYIKRLPEYFDDIAYWAPKIAKFIGIFYAVTGAVKVANVAMSVFNTMVSIDLGPMKKLGTEVGTNIPQQFGKASEAAAMFKGALGLITSFVAGWEIGQLIYEQLTKHLIEAHKIADEINKIGTGHLSNEELKSKRSVLTDTIKKEQESWFTDDDEIRMLRTEIRNIDRQLGINAMKSAREAIEGPGPVPAPSPTLAPVRPSVQVSESSTVNVNREENEITIKDETGRARLTRGRGRNLKLVHTGGLR